MKLRRNSQRKRVLPCCLRGELPAPPNYKYAMLFEGGWEPPPITKINNMNGTIEMIMEQADIYGLRHEVRATAIAIAKEDPTITTGSAYAMAAYEWDIL